MEELIQAYVDVQLCSEERIFVERHVAVCEDCAVKFKELQDLTSHLVTALGPARVSTTFVDRVTECLPDIYDSAMTQKKIHDLNRLTKQEDMWHRLSRLVPYAATLVLAGALVFLMSVWPEEPLGVVAKVNNSAHIMRADPRNRVPVPISIGDAILPGDSIVISDQSRIILALETAELKVNGGSMLRVLGDREVELVKGALYADVDKSGQPFKVKLSSGDVTVLGTRFVVQALQDKTVVTVAEGSVFFNNSKGYSEIEAGSQSVSFAGGTPSAPEVAEVPKVTRWADDFLVTVEDKALARARGAVLPADRYANAPQSMGEPVQTKTLLFNAGSGRSVIRYLTINRDAFGTSPDLPSGDKFAIYVCDFERKPLGRVEASYSIFDGTDRLTVLPLQGQITVNGMCFIIFQPFAESDLTNNKNLPAVYSGLRGTPQNIEIQALSDPPTTEGADIIS
jgi:hypothetical protein